MKFDAKAKEQQLNQSIQTLQEEMEVSVEKKKRKKKIRKEKVYVSKKTLQVSPLLGWDESDNLAIQTKFGYQDIYQIQGYNIRGMSIDDRYRILESFGHFGRLYASPFKIVMLHFPVPTNEQQNYYKNKILKATNPNHKKVLQSKLQEHIFIGNNRSNTEFFLIIYGRDKKELEENRTNLEHFRGYVNIYPISKEKKKQIYFKLNNLGSKIM